MYVQGMYFINNGFLFSFLEVWSWKYKEYSRKKSILTVYFRRVFKTYILDGTLHVVYERVNKFSEVGYIQPVHALNSGAFQLLKKD
jgi:hypothetical protein